MVQMTLRTFKLINLVGGFNKLMDKVLANRIKKVVGKVVRLVPKMPLWRANKF